MQISSANELRVAKKLLWETIAELLRPAEKDEVKRALGQSLIDENEAIYDEASALADILGDVQLSTKALMARQQLCSNPQRTMVETEISLLLDRLRGVASVAAFHGSSVKERDPESVLPKGGPNDKAVYDYLVASTAAQAGDARPRTALVRPGTASTRPTTASSLSRPSTASSAASGSQNFDATSIVATMQDKLNVWDIDKVREVLRGLFQEERTILLEDVEYLTSLLDEETELQAKAAVPPPSLQELKQYSSKLQDVVVFEEARLEHEHRVRCMFAAAEEEASKAGRLRRMVSASRDAPLGASTLQPANGPQILSLHSTTAPPSRTSAGHGAPSQSTLPVAALPASHQAASSPLRHVPTQSPSRSSSRPGSGSRPPLPAQSARPGSSGSNSTHVAAMPGHERPHSSGSTAGSRGSSSRPSSRDPAHKSDLKNPSTDTTSTTTLLRPVSESTSSRDALSVPMSAPLPPMPSIHLPGEGSILSNAAKLSPLRTHPLSGGDGQHSQALPGTSSPMAGLIDNSSFGRVRPSSPARLRAIVSQDVDGILNSSNPTMGGASLQGYSTSPAAGAAHGALAKGMHVAAYGLSAGHMPGSSMGPNKALVRDVGSQLDADASAAIGGVAAILAKHNYRPRTSEGSRPGTSGS